MSGRYYQPAQELPVMSLVDLVNCHYGSYDCGGNCIPGPYLPYGMAMPGPDGPTTGMGPHGYDHRIVCRFSANHVNGTGGLGRYGNCSIMPFCGEPPLDHPGYPLVDEEARVGHYGVSLGTSGMRHELTATRQVAVHRCRFPAGAEHGFLFDAGSVIKRGQCEGELHIRPVAGLVEWLNDRELQGWCVIKGGWGHRFPYQIHFFVRFDRPVCRRQVVRAGERLDDFWADDAGPMAIAWFDEGQVEARVGISHVSVANARRAVDDEAAAPFDELVARNRACWEEELAVIQVTGDPALQRELASALYRLFSMPTDLGQDENPWWHSERRNFTDYYCLWDSVRNANGLQMLIKPQLQADMINDLLDINQHRGWLPDAWIAGHSGHVQGGVSAAIIIAEAAAKGIAGIDYEAALAALLHNCDDESPDPHLAGRHAAEWRERGWLPDDIQHCLSRSLEYAYQDHCLAGLAARLGQADVAERYGRQAQTVWALWQPASRCFQPRRRDGSWLPDYDTWQPTRPDFWFDPYCYEGTAQEWALTALHLIDRLAAAHGGADAFCDHLETLLTERLFCWKEIILHLPWLPLEVGRPERAAALINAMRARYSDRHDGMPDNEDFGAQSAFVVGSITGLYPVMGQDRYWISCPLVSEARYRLPAGTLTISCPGADGQAHPLSAVRLNGVCLDRPWVTHAEIAGGGRIEIERA